MNSYIVTVVVEQLNDDGQVINQVASWELDGIRFGSCADAVNHGQKVRKAANKIKKVVQAK